MYVQDTLSPVRPHGHYQLVDSNWRHVGFREVPLEWRDDYVVGFVRNPYSLLVSWYALMHRMDVQMHHYDRELAILSFRDFVTLLAHRRHSWPQRYPLHWQLFDEDWSLGVNYLGRFETLDADLRHIAEITGATYTPREPSNAAPHQPYREFYDNSLIRLVDEAWHADLSYFGYDIDGPTGQHLVEFGPGSSAPAPNKQRPRFAR